MRGSTGVGRGLAAHVVPGDLHLEERPVGAHAQLEAQPVAVAELIPVRRARQPCRADHHTSVQDDAVFLLRRGQKINWRITTSNVNKADCF